MSMKKCNQCEDYVGKFNYCPMCGLFLGHNDFQGEMAPVVTEDRFGETEESHPAYAQLAFSRINTSKSDTNTLYGSAIRHQTVISMRVYPSRKSYSNYNEHYFANSMPYIEVEMSQSQFSEAITSLNMSPVPVTLRALRGKWMPRCQELTVQEKTQRDLNSQLKKLAVRIATDRPQVNDILTKKGPLSAQDKKDLLGIYDRYLTEISSNLPFLNECMQEVLDKNTTAAKADIEAMLLHSITTLGLNALHEKQSLITNDDIIKKTIE